LKLTIQIFIFVSIFFCGSTKAQNFLYNPNFEIVGDSLPAGHGHWFACDGAYNLNGEHFLPYGPLIITTITGSTPILIQLIWYGFGKR